ncbi:type II toxin-antitoxin system Phd/YefM family antitoxin [Phenylobacterium sp.]|uniref:type II toxin-antitoxin system Phd/YefM family antitoxin n=1 Tax=Phenylobacterium sp. TaxID=1871053 RepID=UPI003983709A
MPDRTMLPIQRRGARPASWKLEDAKARFSEVVRRARSDGPQAVTVRGHRAVVILDADDYERLAAPAASQPLVEFLESLHAAGLDLTRESDTGRQVDL